jgi:uncharacterized alkaline shock family protein YloU
MRSQQEQAWQRSPLQSERGSTRIENSVVSKIAGRAAQEVEGVLLGDGSTSRAIGRLLGGVTGGEDQPRGVSAEVSDTESAVDVTLTVEYGRSIPRIAEAVRRNIVDRIENLVGVRVKEVNITVADVVASLAGDPHVPRPTPVPPVRQPRTQREPDRQRAR